MIRSRIGTVFVAVVALGSITILTPGNACTRTRAEDRSTRVHLPAGHGL
jgi:hypothetical protein